MALFGEVICKVKSCQLRTLDLDLLGNKIFEVMSRLENNFGTSEVLFVPLISPSVKFMNHFRVFKKWYLKSF